VKDRHPMGGDEFALDTMPLILIERSAKNLKWHNFGDNNEKMSHVTRSLLPRFNKLRGISDLGRRIYAIHVHTLVDTCL
jgi:hypothetical protein